MLLAAAAAAAGLLLAPEAMHIHVPRAWVLGLSDARAVQRRVVKAVVAVGEVEGKNQGTEDSAHKTSARGRNPENFVFVVVVGKLGGRRGLWTA